VSQLLDNNTARRITALSLTRPLELDPNPRMTRSGRIAILYDSSYNRSSDVWCDGAIVISRDSEVGPIIRRTSVLHDWLRQQSCARAGFKPTYDWLRHLRGAWAVRVDLCRTGWHSCCLGQRAAAVEVFTLPNYEESHRRSE